MKRFHFVTRTYESMEFDGERDGGQNGIVGNVSGYDGARVVYREAKSRSRVVGCVARKVETRWPCLG